MESKRELQPYVIEKPYATFWSIFVVLGLMVEFNRLLKRKEGGTFSRWTALVFCTHTQPGRFAWRTFWGTFATWYLVHIDNWYRYNHRDG